MVGDQAVADFGKMGKVEEGVARVASTLSEVRECEEVWWIV